MPCPLQKKEPYLPSLIRKMPGRCRHKGEDACPAPHSRDAWPVLHEGNDAFPVPPDKMCLANAAMKRKSSAMSPNMEEAHKLPSLHAMVMPYQLGIDVPGISILS